MYMGPVIIYFDEEEMDFTEIFTPKTTTEKALCNLIFIDEDTVKAFEKFMRRNFKGESIEELHEFMSQSQSMAEISFEIYETLKEKEVFDDRDDMAFEARHENWEGV